MKVPSGVGREIRGLWGDGKGRLLAVISTGWCLLIGTRMIYPVVLPYLRTAFDLSLSVAGLLLTTLWLGSAIGQLPGGVLADRHSERAVMAASVIVAAAALVCVVVATTSTVLFVATALFGLGLSQYPIARITILTDIYPEQTGSALGVTMATGDLGQTILPPAAGVLAVAVGWHFGLGLAAPLLLLVGVAIWTVLPTPVSEEGAIDALSVESARRVGDELRQSNLSFVAFILFLYIFVWQSFTGLYPTYLVEVKGLSSSVASLLFSVFFAFGVIVKPMAGVGYDWIGIRGSLVAVLVGPAIALALLPTIEGFWPLVAVTAVVSVMLGSGAITQSFLADSFSEDTRGTGLGVIRTGVSTLGAAGPVLLGTIADLGYFDEGYLALAAILLAVILLTLRLPKAGSA